MGAWKKAVQLLKDAYVSRMRKLVVVYYLDLLNEWKQACDERVADALRVRNDAVEKRRELEVQCHQLAYWMQHSGTGTVCLGRVNRMDEFGDIAPEFTIVTVQNTNEFKFVRDMLKDGSLGHATSTRGVHPAKRWGIKDWEYSDE